MWFNSTFLSSSSSYFSIPNEILAFFFILSHFFFSFNSTADWFLPKSINRQKKIVIFCGYLFGTQKTAAKRGWKWIKCQRRKYKKNFTVSISLIGLIILLFLFSICLILDKKKTHSLEILLMTSLEFLHFFLFFSYFFGFLSKTDYILLRLTRCWLIHSEVWWQAFECFVINWWF